MDTDEGHDAEGVLNFLPRTPELMQLPEGLRTITFGMSTLLPLEFDRFLHKVSPLDLLLEPLHLLAQFGREDLKDPSIRVLIGKRPGDLSSTASFLRVRAPPTSQSRRQSAGVLLEGATSLRVTGARAGTQDAVVSGGMTRRSPGRLHILDSKHSHGRCITTTCAAPCAESGC